MRPRIRRVGRAVVVLAAVATALTACTPGRQPLLAMALVDGLPVALLHPCHPGSAEFSVTENTQVTATSPAPSASASPSASPTPAISDTITPPTETYVYSWSIRTDDAPMVVELELFTIPTGWVAGKQTLNALQKGSRYIADAKLTGVFDVSPVNFTMDELLELEPDQVLSGINAPLTSVVSRAEFDATAQQSCTDAHPSPTG